MHGDVINSDRIIRETRVEIIAWSGHCEVHERFTAAEIRLLREQHPGGDPMTGSVWELNRLQFRGVVRCGRRVR